MREGGRGGEEEKDRIAGVKERGRKGEILEELRGRRGVEEERRVGRENRKRSFLCNIAELRNGKWE